MSAIKLYVVPLIVVVNFVPKEITSLVGCVANSTSTTAVGAVIDVGVYPSVFAFATTALFVTAVPINASFANCCA